MMACLRGDHEGTETGAHMETMQGDGCCRRGRTGCFGSTEFRHLTHNGGGGGGQGRLPGGRTSKTAL